MGTTITSGMSTLPKIILRPPEPEIIYSGDEPAVCVVPLISTTTLGAVVKDEAMSVTLESLGSAPFVYTVSAGTLPTGLALAGATISGTPTVAGAYNFTIQATNACGNDTQAFTGTVSVAATVGFAWLSTSSGAQDGEVGVPYSKSFANPGDNEFGTWEGNGTIVWSVNGTLPNGLTWNTGTNVISGTPTQAGLWAIQIIGDNGLNVELPYSNVLDYNIVIV